MIEEVNITGRFHMPIETPVPFLQNAFSSEIDSRNKTNGIIHQSIARGYDDLVNGRVRPWTQAKAEADRMRAINHPSPM